MFDKTKMSSIGPTDFGVTTPLATDGTKIQFVSRSPTSKELQECPHIELTSKTDWNPTEIALGQLSTSPGELPSETVFGFGRDSLNDCPKAILSLTRIFGAVQEDLSHTP